MTTRNCDEGNTMSHEQDIITGKDDSKEGDSHEGDPKEEEDDLNESRHAEVSTVKETRYICCR